MDDVRGGRQGRQTDGVLDMQGSERALRMMLPPSAAHAQKALRTGRAEPRRVARVSLLHTGLAAPKVPLHRRGDGITVQQRRRRRKRRRRSRSRKSRRRRRTKEGRGGAEAEDEEE